MKIKNKIYLFSTVTLLIILLIINSSIYWLFAKVTTDGEIDRLKREALHITDGLNQEGVEKIDPATLLQPYLPTNGMLRIIDADSRAIVTQEADGNEPMPRTEPRFERKATEGQFEAKGMEYGFVKVPVIWTDGRVMTLEVTESFAGLQRNLNMLKNVLFLASLFVLIPAFFAGRMLSNLILRPVNSMIQTMEDIQVRGIFKKIPLEHQSKDELYKMGNTFNKMMGLLQQNFEKQQQFVSDASHELKTPLTVIESYAKLLKRWGTKKPDVLEESVEAIHSEAVRMKAMTNQMLMLANNSAEWNLDIQRINLVNVCQTAADQLTHAYGRTFQLVSNEESVIVSADEQKIKQVLVVLLDNAMKYSSDAIEIDVGIDQERVFFSVKDSGMGIPKEDLSQVFDRFFRVDKARNRETGGTGLGLSIAKRIVDAHEGEMQLESEEGKWTKVTVLLPNEEREV
ncbi:ATP-binding protein [Bacillus sp. FJAT-42315]|uniref:ATP-binding protein n=1 Tax=Bacillus sp. FJAT-42315 TaxID=2014077 RepID=UPI000C24FCF1|nr:ATP-binding protein [Bacillus sp. FJAT-42315]